MKYLHVTLLLTRNLKPSVTIWPADCFCVLVALWMELGLHLLCVDDWVWLLNVRIC